MFGKKGKVGGMEGAIAGGIIAVIAILAAFYMFGGGTSPQIIVGEGDQQVVAAPSTACTGGNTQSLDINAYDVESPGTALTEGNNLWWYEGSWAGTSWTQGTAITGLETGKNYLFAVGPSATASNEYDNAYGPQFKINNLPCVVSTKIGLFQDEVEGSLTATFLNHYGNAAAESVVAGQDTTVYAEWYAGSKEYFGNPWLGVAFMSNPYITDVNWDSLRNVNGIEFIKATANGNHRPEYPNTICVQYNTTTWDDIDWVKVTLQNGDTVEMNQVSTPLLYSATAGTRVKCFEAPVISDTTVKFAFRLDPDDTTAASTDDITAYLYSGSWGINTDTGALLWGAEDNDGNALGASDPDTLSFDFT
ncbi:MAG TPA: hypothetical protein ENK70_05390 [Methylophaga sp.]|nr:hypothetical protein [Methylophaga sp.]